VATTGHPNGGLRFEIGQVGHIRNIQLKGDQVRATIGVFLLNCLELSANSTTTVIRNRQILPSLRVRRPVSIEPTTFIADKPPNLTGTG